jgi:hypothetical protein
VRGDLRVFRHAHRAVIDDGKAANLLTDSSSRINVSRTAALRLDACSHVQSPLRGQNLWGRAALMCWCEEKGIRDE